MKSTIGRRAQMNTRQEENKSCAARGFVELNTHHNITIKREYVYIEDVKAAVNINTLEERIILKRWLIRQLQAGFQHQELIQLLFDSVDKDRHRLVKGYQICL
jgi:hypothetical protein